jgi:hypothetical protein
MRERTRPSCAWRKCCSAEDMDFAAAVDRVRFDFIEMPGLELTMPQAVRLWGMGMDDCRFVVDALVDAGFLHWTSSRTLVRTRRNLDLGGPAEKRDIRVHAVVRRNRSVER